MDVLRTSSCPAAAARLQATRGSLYSKLRKPALASEAWQRTLSLDPEDAVVAAALRELDEVRP